MPNWNQVRQEMIELKQGGNDDAIDIVRRKYLNSISHITNRNTITYYSGFLTNPETSEVSINDNDKIGLMLAIHGLDTGLGLDLILHTPGGETAATESIIDYLYSIFNNDIRVIIPQISMSAGTMIALASKEILMGKQSNLGPIDPQVGGLACKAILDEFEQAKRDIRINPNYSLIWQNIIGKYHPTLLLSCKQSIEWSKRIVYKCLMNNMCNGDEERVNNIVEIFSDHNTQKAHVRHISKQECIDAGLEIINLEDDQNLQDAVLTTHHAYMHTFSNTNFSKIIENQIGAFYFA